MKAETLIVPQATRGERRVTVSITAILKRMIDIICSLLGIIVSLPVFCIIAAAVSLDGGPVFFAHRRIGRNGKSFDCWKFRSMMVGAEDCLTEYLHFNPDALTEWQRDHKLAVDPRITSIGSFLRKTSLDELPQLWNVIVGEMSLVGPRPVTAVEMQRYGSFADIVTAVRPGITGPWQIGGRNEVSYDQRIAMDVQYVCDQSLLNDITILLQTPIVVLSQRGAK
jgi:exopolysaccharide production protein ExoY